MKLLKWSQWKTAALAFVLLLSIMLTGGTLAYFTDSREDISVFTAGNVYITLTEAEVQADAVGNLVEDPSKDRIEGAELGAEETIKDYGKIYPGQTIYKDPTITNTGDNGAWIAAKVVVSDGRGDIHKLMGYYGVDFIDIEVLLHGGLLDEYIHVGAWNGIQNVCHNDNYAMVQVADRANGVYEFYFFMLKATQKGDEIVLFDTMSIVPEWDNAQMCELVDLKIKVQAFAVQTFGFESCFDAMKGAFATHFEKCVANP
ncbi:MAG: hypothetical protein J6A63_01810 [Clostridia bacterium]|nr:hypothetical protein [Clostridia bacterium]